MGRTYKANNPEAKGSYGDKGIFDVNYSGADILGLLAHAVNHHNKPLEEDNKKWGIVDRAPSTLFSSSAVECKVHAAALQAMTDVDEQLEPIYAKIIRQKLWDSSYADFKCYINSWVNFLMTCDGYEVE